MRYPVHFILLTVSFTLILSASGLGQNDYGPKVKPALLYGHQDLQFPPAFAGNPPPAPVRQPAEFEPMEGVMIRFPFGIPYSLIAEMSEDTGVVTIVLDAKQQKYVEGEYMRYGVNLNNCSFLHAPTETHWTRDYGPWFVITGNQDQGVIDNIYPWPGPGDDNIPIAYGNDQGIPVYETGLYHEGGNYMTEGQGTAVSTNFLWKCNPGVSQQYIYDTVYDFLGVHNYLVIQDALAGYFLHIDCYAKFLSPDTIMILEVAPGNKVYDYLEDIADYFEGRISCYGTPYKVARVYGPNGEPYTNSLILNRKVLIPFTGSQWDDDAVKSYEDAMPGYEVLGFLGSWYSHDALHCRTKEITDRYMLYIHHVPLLDRPPEASGFPIKAEIVAYSGQNFIGGTPAVFWSTGGAWNSVSMTPAGGDDYLAYIPPQPPGTMVQYYIHAEDASGRSEDHPYIGEPGAHSFLVNDLGVDRSALSTLEGGEVNLYLNAGASNANRNYFILGSLSGTQPGIGLPGGLTLPLNWDPFTVLIFQMANTPFFADFQGALDASGAGAAQFNSYGPLPRELEGLTFYFAYTLYNPFDFVSNSVEINILE